MVPSESLPRGDFFSTAHRGGDEIIQCLFTRPLHCFSPTPARFSLSSPPLPCKWLYGCFLAPPRDSGASMGLSTAVDAAAAAAEATLAQRNPVAAAELNGDIRAAARAARVTANVDLASPARTRRGTTERQQRTSMSLVTKLQITTWKEHGIS